MSLPFSKVMQWCVESHKPPAPDWTTPRLLAIAKLAALGLSDSVGSQGLGVKAQALRQVLELGPLDDKRRRPVSSRPERGVVVLTY